MKVQDKEGQEPSPPSPVKEKDEVERAEVEAGPLKPSSTNLVDLSMLKDGAFIWYSLFGLFATLGFFAPQLYIIELSKSRGVEPSMASYMLSVMAVAEIFGRLSIGVVLNKVSCRKTLVLLWCVICLCLVLVAFAIVWEFWGLVVCCALYGYFMGTVGSTHIPMLAEEDVVGIQKMPASIGVYVFIQSFAGLAGPPLGGKNYYLFDFCVFTHMWDCRFWQLSHLFSRCVGGCHTELRRCLLLLCRGHGAQCHLLGSSWPGQIWHVPIEEQKQKQEHGGGGGENVTGQQPGWLFGHGPGLRRQSREKVCGSGQQLSNMNPTSARHHLTPKDKNVNRLIQIHLERLQTSQLLLDLNLRCTLSLSDKLEVHSFTGRGQSLLWDQRQPCGAQGVTPHLFNNHTHTFLL